MNSTTVIEQFEAITLSQMEGVKLMNRTDCKFCLHSDQLCELLSEIHRDYYLLDINGERNQRYQTTYFDTTDNEMYRNHHRGKMNRYKIRRRNYLSTNDCFLEVKFKNNKGRTLKVRQTADPSAQTLDHRDDEFLQLKTPYSAAELRPVTENSFNRLMLVSRSMSERCTIDSNLTFVHSGTRSSIEGLVIIEVKRDGRATSAIIDALHKRRIRPSGLSKYCVGRSLTESDLQKNRFKAKHRQLSKLLNCTTDNIIQTEI